MLKNFLSVYLTIAFAAFLSIGKEQGEEISPFKKFLPDILSSLEIGRTSQQQLISIMGKPLKTEGGQNYFYNVSGRNYDTTIGISDNTVSYILYSPPAGSLRFAQLKPYISQQIIDQAYRQKLKTSESHSSGRAFDVSLPDQNIRMTIRNNSQESVQSILFLK